MKLMRYLMPSAVLLAMLAGQSGAAVGFIWPKNNSIVRESVNVAVDASSVPSGGYVSFYLNGVFISAAGLPTSITDGRKAFTWAWDTRDPINLAGPNDPPKRPSDGSFDISARVVGVDGTLIDQGTVRVRLSNKVTSVSAIKPIQLRYFYRSGQVKKYLVRIGVTLREVGGAPVTGTRELQAVSYTGTASVEDIEAGNLAVVRYRPFDSNFVVLGEKLGSLPRFQAGSLYQLVDPYGRVRETDLYSTVGVATDPTFKVDYRTPLPMSSVKAGDKWTGPMAISMPTLGDATISGFMTFDSLEWAGGRECVRINTEIKGTAMASIQQMLDEARQRSEAQASATEAGTLVASDNPFAAAPPTSMGMDTSTMSPGSISGSGSDWFAFRTGELIRRELNADLDMTIDQAALQSLTEGLGIAGKAEESQTTAKRNTGAYDQPEQYIEDMSAGMRKVFGRTQSPTVDTGTKVKLRVHVSARLLN
ncbi:MAG: hypothetical protein WCL39_13115 [Armatimonadota bacterium]